MTTLYQLHSLYSFNWEEQCILIITVTAIIILFNYAVPTTRFTPLRLRKTYLISKGKGKNCPSAFKWEPRHEGVLWEWRYSSTHSLTSALDWGEWSASRPGRFTPRERVPSNHWMGAGWVPVPFLTRWWRKNLQSPSQWLLVYLTTLY
jgi:hypothetical protein